MFGKSAILKTLGPSSFAEFTAVRVPGKVIWFNFALARECGFEVPLSNVLTPELHDRLVHMFSLRALRSGESLDGRAPVPLYADRYGGVDILPGLGAGRAGFLSEGNFYLKGIGHTPLFRFVSSDDFQHTHGKFSIRESVFEAVFGEVNTNLLTKGSARILAIIDQGDDTVYPNGEREPRAVAVRAGAQLRPAHLFVKGVKGSLRLELFLRMVSSTGQLVLKRRGGRKSAVPDLRATMLRIIEDHAIAAAELFRWRMVHGAISMSNMEMSGAMLDTTTQSAQPRTAPLKILTYHSDANIVYGKEHMQRAQELRIMYAHITRSLSEERRLTLNATRIDFAAEMSLFFEKHLQKQILSAAGLQKNIVCRIQRDYPETVSRFTSVVAAMAALRNPGSVNANREAVEDISVVDVFNCLGEYPALYFSGGGISAAHTVRELLRPVFRGNRFYRDHKRAAVERLTGEFVAAHSAVMAACEQIAKEYYRSRAEMRRSIALRAAGENRPLELLYRWNILKEFKAAVASYRSTGDTEVISSLISRTVAASFRDAEN